MLIFQKCKELEDSELKNFAFEQFEALAKEMKAFEQGHYKHFLKRANSIFKNALKKTVLTVVPHEKEIGKHFEFVLHYVH